jgi:hypothetical protein
MVPLPRRELGCTFAFSCSFYSLCFTHLVRVPYQLNARFFWTVVCKAHSSHPTQLTAPCWPDARNSQVLQDVRLAVAAGGFRTESGYDSLVVNGIAYSNYAGYTSTGGFRVGHPDGLLVRKGR